MVSSKLFVGAVVFVIGLCLLDSCEGWSGHYQRVRRYRGYWRRYCICWYWWWGCSYRRWRWVSYYYYTYRCQPGWTHNGNQNCNIAICRPSCINGGTCIRPNVCQCPSTATGSNCQNPVCSYLLPCYPGSCIDNSKCQCEAGFRNGLMSNGKRDGCLEFDSGMEAMYPVISKCTATILNRRRTDNRTNFMFVMDGTNTTDVEQVWSNQKRFNVLEFQIESMFPEIENLPERPVYVFDAGFGIVQAQVQVNVSKVSRSGSPIRDAGVFTTYQCPDLSHELPETDMSNCSIYDDQFRTLIEHGDWMEVDYQSTSGGFRDLHNIDSGNRFYRTDHYRGLHSVQKVKFLFDFNAPKYCEDEDAYRPSDCPPDSVMLEVEEEFTRNAIRPRWKGWQDDLSGMEEYYVEVFRLLPDPYGRLVERHPLDPLFTNITAHDDYTIKYPEYIPDRAGVYSVLVEARDRSNNTVITRRCVIHDRTSEIVLNQEYNGKLYVESANEQTGYTWQTTANADGSVTFIVRWDNHFRNPTHENGKFLNEILPYPIQFNQIEDEGVLSSKKYVRAEYDDFEGQLTRNGTTNFHGIVKFEVNKVFTQDTAEPTTGWEDIKPLKESYTFTSRVQNGQSLRFWVRAYDVMGNTKTNYTNVRVDTTGPQVTGVNSSDTKLELNYNERDAKFNYTSRITFKAADTESGIHVIQYAITVESFGRKDKTMFTGNQSANFKKKDEFCTGIDGYCYFPDQTLDIDNCWFMVAKEDLTVSRATVSVTAYNRAMIGKTLAFSIGRINTLHGLQEYSGPDNFRITDREESSFLISWDLPDKVSCYGLASILLVIVEDGTNITETVLIPSTKSSHRVYGKKPNTKYRISTAMELVGGSPVSAGTDLSVKTLEEEAQSGVPGGVVGGIVAGMLALVVVVIVVFVVLIRRGHFQPVRRGVTRAKTIVTRKASETFYGESSHQTLPRAKNNAYAYDNRASELYIYGGMDFDETQSWHIPRADITFETLIKNGHFANIYKATLNKNKKKHETVVAKTLKENFSENDEMLMKAKINFTGTVVGTHPNIVKFIGAVVEDHAMGPFIIYEYCEHGPLKDYLQSQKSNVTLEVQESLFRFGLDIAKGMEYLASKGIVHRRLAARNILLTFLNEIKISGFGPQPVGGGDEDGDAEKGKKERIPIKWVGPECMESTAGATEKTDVWSYAVVLWEIFTLGATPYENIRSRDLPGRLKKGERLQQPEYCDDTWYGVMKQCWVMEPKKRPTFSDVRNQLDGLFVAAPGDDYYYYKH